MRRIALDDLQEHVHALMSGLQAGKQQCRKKTGAAARARRSSAGQGQQLGAGVDLGGTSSWVLTSCHLPPTLMRTGTSQPYALHAS